MARISLRITGYASRKTIRLHRDTAVDTPWLDIFEGDDLVRISMRTPGQAAVAGDAVEMVMKLVGTDRIPSGQVGRQPGASVSEISITLIDEEKRPIRAVGTEEVSLREAVLEFIKTSP